MPSQKGSVGIALMIVVLMAVGGYLLTNTFSSGELPPIDTEQVALLNTIAQQESAGIPQSCTISSQTTPLAPTDRFSDLIPQRLALYYADRQIGEISIPGNDTGNEFQYSCLTSGRNTYVIFQARSFDECTDINPCIVYSNDSGQTWSPTQSWADLASAGSTLPFSELNRYFKIIGDSDNLAIATFNLPTNTTSLYDHQFRTLRKIPPDQRLSPSRQANDFIFFQDSIFLIDAQPCSEGELTTCTYLENSGDYGQTWIKTKLDNTATALFLKNANSLYLISHQNCGANLALIPALAKPCGRMSIQQINSNGAIGASTTLSTTVSDLKAVLNDNDHGPRIVWVDSRLQRPRTCGFIPIVGCVDSSPFSGPSPVYAGKLNLSSLDLQEFVVGEGYLDEILQEL